MTSLAACPVVKSAAKLTAADKMNTERHFMRVISKDVLGCVRISPNYSKRMDTEILVAIRGPISHMLIDMASAQLEMTPRELKQLLEAAEPVRLIDVREPFEYELSRIDGFELIPMRTIPGHLAALQNESAPIVVLCHHGVRSLQVVNWLRQQGIERCSSLSGGIDEWSREIDRSIPRY